MKSYLPSNTERLSSDLTRTTFFMDRASQFFLASFSIESETSTPVTSCAMLARGMTTLPTPHPKSRALLIEKLGSTCSLTSWRTRWICFNPPAKNSSLLSRVRLALRNLSLVITAKYGSCLASFSQSRSVSSNIIFALCCAFFSDDSVVQSARSCPMEHNDTTA